MALILAYSRWILSFGGAALLAALVWFFGPFLTVLEGRAIRLAIVVLMFAVWAIANLLLDRRRRRREAALTEGVVTPAPDATARAAAEETAALREKLVSALALLKKARGTKGYLYEQPWYAIIGPPGAGKTTALLNAGLSFPLAAEMGQGAVAGVGGTRLCDWWFTEDAVLIDTAGRYTTQDSDAAVDHAGWEGFLDLLKRTRPRQPINGVIVAIAIPDIAGAPPGQRQAHALAVRRRIKELEEKLAIRLPVYALFTKADLIAGFTEFFDDLDRERRAQVWGATFPLASEEHGPANALAAEFTALVERLNQRLFDRLQAERSPDRRALIAGFPAQVESLAPALDAFIREAFGGSRLDPAPMLRGFYLTSGTQQGTPIDRLTGFLARTFGIDQRRAPVLRPEHGRSYFLARLLKEVIFGEAMLVAERPGAARRRLLIRAGAFALCGVAVLAGGGFMWQRSAASRQDLSRMNAALAGYEKIARGLPLDPVADGDLAQVLPLLDAARRLPYGYDDRAAERASWRLPGLSAEGELAAGARIVYRHALERVLLPRLLWRLEAGMYGNMDRPDFLYQATRVYLMLGNEGPLDRGLVRAWMRLDWETAYPGPAMTADRADLARHLAALLREPLPSIPLDGALVAAARATFSRVPLAERVYSRIVPSAAARALKPWRPDEVLGVGGADYFVRASGKKLSDGIPGFYTVDGFYKVLLPTLPDAVKDVVDESWVLGKQSELQPNSADAKQLPQNVIALYESDYEKRWDRLLADLQIVPLRPPVQQAAADLNILAAPHGPMRDLLAGIVHQLELTKPPALQVATGAATKAAAGAMLPKTTARVSELKNLFAPIGGAETSSARPGRAVENHYRTLIDFVGNGPGAPLDQALAAITALQRQLAATAAQTPGTAGSTASGENAAALLRAEAARDPQPVGRWLEAIAASAAPVQSGSVEAAVKAAWNGPAGPALLCEKAVRSRYPFAPGAAEDIPLEDFARLLSPSGELSTFFNTQLQPYVNTGGPVWRGREVDGVPPPVSPAALAQFQRAALIRDLFFGAGGNTPSVQFALTPINLDDGATEVTLELGDTTIRYAHGPPRATQIIWPGTTGMNTARLVFDPAPPGGAGVLQATGPWAMFRLFAEGDLQQEGSPDRYRLTFTVGNRRAVFELRAGSVLNPFAPGLLRNFRCPSL